MFCLNFWDCAGQEKFGGLRDGYYIGGQAALIFSDVLSRISEKNTALWKRDVQRVMSTPALCYIKHKTDVEESPDGLPRMGRIEDEGGIPAFAVSTKLCAGLLEPLECLLQQYANDTSLRVLSVPECRD